MNPEGTKSPNFFARHKKVLIIVGVLLAVLVAGGAFAASQMRPANDAVTVEPQAESLATSEDISSPSTSQTPSDSDAAVSSDDNASSKPTTSKPSTSTGSTGSGSSAPAATPPSAPTPATHTITFNGSSYSPSSLTVKSGDTIVFVNSSGVSTQPSSDNHPSHTLNSQLNFGVISAGSQMSKMPTTAGAWGMHDHLHPSVTATIIVQ